MFDLLREIIQTLRNNKLRTSLTGFAVAWGIFMLIILLGVSNGVYNSFRKDVMSSDAKISMYNGYTTIPYKGLKENRYIKMQKSDIVSIANEKNEHIGDVSAEINLSSTISTTKDYITGSLQGVYPAYSEWVKLSKGRFINSRDLLERRKVMVISKSNANILFENPDYAIGKQVKCMDLSFTIVGIFDSQGNNNSLIPFTTASLINGDNNDVSMITISTKELNNIEQAEELESNIRETLSRNHKFDPNDKSAIWIWNQFIQQVTMLGGLSILNIAIWIIGILTMLSGIVGVSNIMIVSVRERTHEIGIRRAIGAKPRNILLQIVLESVSITALFGYIGIFFGICITEVIAVVLKDTATGINPVVDIKIAIYVTIVLIIAGALAGIFPALKALKVKPVEALRTE